MSVPGIFHRVLDAYARLSEDEAVAWRDQDFDAVQAVQERKRSLIPILLRPSASTDPALVARARALIDQEERNFALASAVAAEVRAARQTLQSSTSHLHAVRGSYGRPAGPTSTFSTLS